MRKIEILTLLLTFNEVTPLKRTINLFITHFVVCKQNSVDQDFFKTKHKLTDIYDCFCAASEIYRKIL